MNTEKFEAFLEVIETCTPEQLVKLKKTVRGLEAKQPGLATIEQHMQRIVDNRQCPHCSAAKAYRHGRDVNGRRRFRCRPVDQGGCG